MDVTRARAGKWTDNAEWVFGRRAARVLGVVALFAVVVALLFVFLNLYVAPNKPGEKKDLVLALAQILGGTALLSGLYFTWRTLQVNREGQITERFTRAIDQLGSNELEIRLGGIYALERIARDSERDHWPIMEVLTAYVRQHAGSLREEGQEGTDDAAVEKKSEENSRGESEPTEVPAPAPDIQAIMTVLRRRTRSFGQGEPEPLDLHEANLTRADLGGANLTGANLTGANLTGANLREVDFTKADLSRADFRGAKLWEADLREAKLWEADLRKAKLARADFTKADLSRADLRGANLEEATLTGADLFAAYLTRADLRKADLRKAKLWANLDLAILWEADLSGASLVKAYLYGANLFGADLSEAELREANLSGANLSGANLVQAQLEETTAGDKNTQLPSDLKPPTHWGVKTDEQIEED